MTRRSGPIWGLVAAAGAGRRFGGERPKQYAELAGRPLLAHAAERLAADARVEGMVVVLPRGGRGWASPGLRFRFDVRLAEGGEDRGRSVANGLERLLAGGAAARDFVLVHDAARPCLHPKDLAALIDAGLDHPGGALLAVPVRDTLKRSRPDVRGPVVDATVPRAGMWRALTPQMFRIGDLHAALGGAFARGETVTDDSQAMERWAAARGSPPPRLVEARFENGKVTTRADLDEVRRRCARPGAGPDTEAALESATGGPPGGSAAGRAGWKEEGGRR